MGSLSLSLSLSLCWRSLTTPPRSACTPSMRDAQTPVPMTTGRSCMKVAGQLSELRPWRLCGRRSTRTGQRDPEPACPNGSVSDLARRLVTQRPPKMRRVVRLLQQRWKKRKKRKKKRRRRKRRKKRKRSKPNLFLQLQTSDLLDIPDWSSHHLHHGNTHTPSAKPTPKLFCCVHFTIHRNIGCAFPFSGVVF